jgi:hypothetical protein
MKHSRIAGAGSRIGRRDFIRVGAGAAAAISMLNVVTASAEAPSPQAVPWWAARPGKGGVGKPEAFDPAGERKPRTSGRGKRALR